MKIALLIILTLFSNAVTLEELTKDVKSALVSGDSEAYEKLIFQNRIPELFKPSILGSIPYYKGGEIQSVEIKEFDKTPEPYLLNGKKYIFTPTPVGQIFIKFKSKGTRGVTYGIQNGSYYIVGIEEQPTNWTGPKDKSIGFTISIVGGNGGFEKYRVKYNRSGTIFTEVFEGTSFIFLGQHIEEIELLEPKVYQKLQITLKNYDGSSESIEFNSPQKPIYKKREQVGLPRISQLFLRKSFSLILRFSLG